MPKTPLLSLVALLAGCAAAPPHEQRAGLPIVDAHLAPGVQRVDRRTCGYLEDEATGRVLAEVRAELVWQDGMTALNLVISAVGPRVDPVPGFEGVRGANRITAREIGILTQQRRILVSTRNATTGGSAPGTYRTGRVGAVPMRRVRPGGAIDWHARTTRSYPLELHVESGWLPAGQHRLELFVDDVSRLRVEFEAAHRAGEITLIEAMGAHGIDS